MSRERWALILAIWRTRQCFVCGGTGDCVHREIEVECAAIDAGSAREARQQEASVRSASLQMVLPFTGCKRVEVERVH